MFRIVIAIALAVVVGCGPRDNNPAGKDIGPTPEKNPKGPGPMKAPGEGNNPLPGAPKKK